MTSFSKSRLKNSSKELKYRKNNLFKTKNITLRSRIVRRMVKRMVRRMVRRIRTVKINKINLRNNKTTSNDRTIKAAFFPVQF